MRVHRPEYSCQIPVIAERAERTSFILSCANANDPIRILAIIPYIDRSDPHGRRHHVEPSNLDVYLISMVYIPSFGHRKFLISAFLPYVS